MAFEKLAIKILCFKRETKRKFENLFVQILFRYNESHSINCYYLILFRYLKIFSIVCVWNGGLISKNFETNLYELGSRTEENRR